MNSAETTDFRYVMTGAPLGDAPVIVWGHGWGQSGAAFAPITEAFPAFTHILLDFPGFGASPPPPVIWGTEDYADVTERLLARLIGDRKIVWVGHSFGGRVGVHLSVRHPDRLRALCMVAAAGLRRKRSLYARLMIKIRIYTFKTLRLLAGRCAWAERMKSRFGSADYRNAGPALRGTFVRVVNEDLTAQAAQIAVPTLLVYGENDTETPSEYGHRYAGLIKGSVLHVLSRQDHYSVLGEGRHIVIKHIRNFLDKL